MSSNSASTAATRTPLQNNLATSKSPYLRQHKDNPVAWQQWTPETLAYAREHNLPIFLSIGYSACHWCHVMEHESFSDDTVAAELNANFVSIKIDREERPDVDRIYMKFVTSTTGSGGWPLNVFLTPKTYPIFGGTYWPGPKSGGGIGRPNFLSIVKRIGSMWKTDEAKLRGSAESVLEQMQQLELENGAKLGASLGPASLKVALQYFGDAFDKVHGGFGGAPKFPNEVNLSFLLAVAGSSSNTLKDFKEDDRKRCLDIVVKTLDKIADGAIHDHVGHGFARYSVTRDWSLPHFEKMSYTNSLLMSCYLDAWLLTGNEKMLQCVEDIAAYFLDDALLHKTEDGDIAFYSAEDADSKDENDEKKEGAFYVYSMKKLVEILGSEEAKIAAAYWNVKPGGNVDPRHDAHGELTMQNTLSVVVSPTNLAQEFDKSREEVVSIIESSRTKLREYREKNRARPLLDDKILTCWNGLAISSLARAGAALKSTKPDLAEKYISSASSAANFIRRNMYDDQTHVLKRVYHSGSAGDVEGLPDDYANMMQGLLSLYSATFDVNHLRWADELQQKQIELFWDNDDGAFFSTAEGKDDIMLRLKDDQDGAEPASNSVSCNNLFELGYILSDEGYTKKTRETLECYKGRLEKLGFALPEMLKGLISHLGGMRSVVVNAEGEKAEEYLGVIRGRLLPSTVVIKVGKDTDEWLVKKNGVLDAVRQGREGVYICEGFSCGMPMSDIKELEEALDEGTLKVSA